MTQKQIAEHLGLSQPLVALALRGHPAVAEKTRQRIVETAKELGYSKHDNSAARTLVARRHGTRVRTGQIAVLMGEPMDGFSLQDMPFFQEILQGIHSQAAKEQLDVAIHILRPGNLPRVLASNGVDGAICIYSRTISDDLKTQGVNLPVVRLADYQSDNWAIYPDDERGTLDTTRQLIQLGHTRIAYFGAIQRHTSDKMPVLRRQGYEKAMHEAHLPLDVELINDQIPNPAQSPGYAAMEELLAQTRDFTAVVCAHDTLAIGAIQAAEAHGLRVPEDLSITGFDGAGAGYGGSSTLTTAFFDRRVMGRRAVEMLEEIAEAPTAPARHEVIPVRLWVRDSTSIPRSIEADSTSLIN